MLLVLGTASAFAVEPPSPPGLGQTQGGGGGGQPDPFASFNQHAELADGELYLLKGKVVMAPLFLDKGRKHVPYLAVDLETHPWLASRARKDQPLYLIEGTAAAWMPYKGSYGELAAVARIQLRIDASGEAQQVISLRPIPELTSIPKRP